MRIQCVHHRCVVLPIVHHRCVVLPIVHHQCVFRVSTTGAYSVCPPQNLKRKMWELKSEPRFGHSSLPAVNCLESARSGAWVSLVACRLPARPHGFQPDLTAPSPTSRLPARDCAASTATRRAMATQQQSSIGGTYQPAASADRIGGVVSCAIRPWPCDPMRDSGRPIPAIGSYWRHNIGKPSSVQ